MTGPIFGPVFCVSMCTEFETINLLNIIKNPNISIYWYIVFSKQTNAANPHQRISPE
jgi:hypothetical protein